MNSIDKLTALFERFPGIGPRQARRFVQYLLSAPPSVRADIANNIQKLSAETKQCSLCFRWYVKDASKDALCSLCADAHRDQKTLFVVEKDADLEQVERTGYKGLYFVLGGTIPLASEEPGKHIRLKELQKRLGEGAVQEVILGLSATSEGDHTRHLLQETLKETEVKISSLGRGLSTGSELEYADPDTIENALSSRH